MHLKWMPDAATGGGLSRSPESRTERGIGRGLTWQPSPTMRPGTPGSINREALRLLKSERKRLLIISMNTEWLPLLRAMDAHPQRLNDTAGY